MTLTGITDPRPQLQAALDQLQTQIAALDAHHLDRPTPCGDFDVRTLLAHLLAVIRKLEVAGNGGDTSQVDDPAGDVTDDWAGMIARARAGLEQVWSADALLERRCRLPWAVMSGREVLDAYAHEFTVHAWDLARVTGKADDLDTSLAEAALAWYRRYLPEESRAAGGPFGPAITVADDAGIFTRLAAFVGRDA